VIKTINQNQKYLNPTPNPTRTTDKTLSINGLDEMKLLEDQSFVDKGGGIVRYLVDPY
jgi:hypothetical protein